MEPIKRKCQEEFDEIPRKFSKSGDDHSLKTLLSWCIDNKLNINSKVMISQEGSCAQYGMVAIEDIGEGECVLDIPRSILLTPNTTKISQLLQSESDDLKSKSGWVPLLIALMYEYLSLSSQWSPYIHLLPDYTQLYLPMFWPQEDLASQLQGTGVPDLVTRDLSNITQEYNNIVLPFINKHRDIFNSEKFSLDLYKKMVAFVMAYSFTEPHEEEEEEEEEEVNRPTPMMVPMADILNHVTDNNAHLDFDKDSLKMVAIRDIKKGEEVYNTYGALTNQELLHMYGFTEGYPHNTHDTVEIPVSVVNDVFCANVSYTEKQLIQEKWHHLQSKEVIAGDLDDFMYLLGMEGFITDWEMYETLKVMMMDRETFRQVDEAGEMSDNEGEDAMNYDDMKHFPNSWKNILKKITEACLKRYSNTLTEDEALLTGDKMKCLPRWQQYCVKLRHSHMKILHKLLQTVTLPDT